MTERLLIAAAIAAICAAAYLLVQGYVALRRRAVLADPAPESGPFIGGGVTVVAFSTAECGRCRDQAREIAAIESRLGGRVRVRKVDALAEPDLAERYGVMTVPTTVVLDGANRPKAVNYGFAPGSTLEAQVHAVLSGEALAA